MSFKWLNQVNYYCENISYLGCKAIMVVLISISLQAQGIEADGLETHSLAVDNLPVGQIESSQAALQDVLSQHKGKVIYLDFWASWCVPCRKSFPWMNKMQQQYQDQGFAVISVNLDANTALAKQFLVNNAANFPVIYDPKGHIAQHFQIKGMPSSMLIDREGRIQQSHSGFFMKKIKSYEAEIVSLIALNNPQ